MFNILVHTGCYIIDLGFCDFLKQFANIRTIIFNNQQCDLSKFDFLLTSNSIFEKSYKNFDFLNNKTFVFDDPQIDILSKDGEEIKLFFKNFFEKKYIELETNEITEREKEIIKFVAHGLTNKEIADKLNISVHTVITHRKNITAKLGIKSIAGLTVYAIMKGITDIEQLNF